MTYRREKKGRTGIGAAVWAPFKDWELDANDQVKTGR